MPETVLVDARPMQGGATGAWDTVLQAGRAALPGVLLDGLIDPDGPPLAWAGFDAIHGNAYAAGRPDCLVRLLPHDPLFVARLIQTVPSVAIATELPPGRLEQALAAYWLRRSDAVVAADVLWPTVRRLMRPGQAADPVAVFTAAPAGTLAAALAARGAHVFGAELVPLLSPRFGRTLFIVGGTADEAGLLTLLRRYGGDVVLTGTCLLGAYGNERATALATAELGQDVSMVEVAQWRDAIARPGALLLGEVVAAARQLFVPSHWVAEQVAALYGRPAMILAVIGAGRATCGRPGPAGVIAVEAAGLQAEACLWALEMLGFWGVEARMVLDCPNGERETLEALATRLEIGHRLTFGDGIGGVAAALAMRGEGRAATGLVAALTSGRCCVASRSVAEGIDIPPWCEVVPDQASPPLLAAALRVALAGERPPEAALTAWAARHAPETVAACLM